MASRCSVDSSRASDTILKPPCPNETITCVEIAFGTTHLKRPLKVVAELEVPVIPRSSAGPTVKHSANSDDIGYLNIHQLH